MQPGSVLDREEDSRKLDAPDPRSDNLNPANNSEGGRSGNGGGYWNPGGLADRFKSGSKKTPGLSPNIAGGEAGANPLAGNGPGVTMPGEPAAPSFNRGGLTPPATGFFSQPIKLFGRNFGNRKQGSLIFGGSGLIAVFISLFMMGSSLYLVHLKNLLTGANNPYESSISTAMQTRRTKSLFKLLKAGSQKIDTTKAATKLRSAGFQVETKGTGFTRISKSFMQDGKEKVIVLDLAGTSDRELAKRLKGLANGAEGPIGRTFFSDFNKVSSEFGSRYNIVAKRNVYRKFFGMSGFFDWISLRQEARQQKAESTGVADNIDDSVPQAQLSDSLINAADTDQSATKLLVKDLTPAEASRLLLDEGIVDPNATVDDVAGQVADDAQKYRQELTGSSGKQVLRGDAEADRVNISGATDDIVAAATSTAKNSTESQLKTTFKKLSTKLGPRISGKVAKGLTGSFDVTGPTRETCRLVGMLEFVKSVRNTLMAIELAKFAVRFYTVADHQQAGLARSTSIKLMSIYMAGAAGSSGVRSLSGGTSVSSTGIDRYGTGYADVGILAVIASFLRKVPFIDAGSCKTVQNPLVQIAGTGVGGVLAVLSGGAVTGMSIGWTVAVITMKEVAFAVALPIMIGSVSGALLNGYETPGEETGNIATAASGALSTMTTGASGGLPMPTSALGPLAQQADSINKANLSNQSFATRYLDFNNSDSLLARASLYMPYSLPGISAVAGKQMSFSNLTNPFMSLFSIFSKPTLADQENKCEDDAVIKYDVATTNGLCSLVLGYVPDVDLDNTEKILREKGQIDIAGNAVPGSDYEKFTNNCFSGRPGVLHLAPEDVSQAGTTEAIDPTCIVWANDGPFTGSYSNDVSEEIDYGKPERVPLIKERFAGWYGFHEVDSVSLSEDINDNLPGMPGYVDNPVTAVATTPDAGGGVAVPRLHMLAGCVFDGTQPPEAVKAVYGKGAQQPGSKEIQRLLNETFGQGGLGVTNRCRNNTADSHSTGQGVDSYFKAYVPSELAKGNSALGWLVTNADIFGLDYAKFWKVEWVRSSGWRCVKSAANAQSHITHIHYQFSWDGALGKTAYFTGASPRDNNQAGNINQDACNPTEP